MRGTVEMVGVVREEEEGDVLSSVGMADDDEEEEDEDADDADVAIPLLAAASAFCCLTRSNNPSSPIKLAFTNAISHAFTNSINR